MKTFEFKKNSWHYWLANFGGPRFHECTDICSYIRYVIYGATLLTIMVLFFGTLGGATLFAIGNVFGWLFLGYELDNITVIVASLFTVFSIMIFVILAKAHYEENIRDNEPGFVRLAYRSWKDKFCARIEFK